MQTKDSWYDCLDLELKISCLTDHYGHLLDYHQELHPFNFFTSEYNFVFVALNLLSIILAWLTSGPSCGKYII